jgi:hypothetical protein
MKEINKNKILDKLLMHLYVDLDFMIKLKSETELRNIVINQLFIEFKEELMSFLNFKLNN